MKRIIPVSTARRRYAHFRASRDFKRTTETFLASLIKHSSSTNPNDISEKFLKKTFRVEKIAPKHMEWHSNQKTDSVSTQRVLEEKIINTEKYKMDSLPLTRATKANFNILTTDHWHLKPKQPLRKSEGFTLNGEKVYNTRRMPVHIMTRENSYTHFGREGKKVLVRMRNELFLNKSYKIFKEYMAEKKKLIHCPRVKFTSTNTIIKYLLQ